MSAADSFGITSARAEAVSDTLEMLAAATKYSAKELATKCDEYLSGKEALAKSLDKYVAGICGKLVPEKDRDAVVRCGRTLILALQILKEDQEEVKIDDVISVDPLSIGLLFQHALSALTKPPSVPEGVLPGNFIEYGDIVPQLLLKVFKTSLTPWKSISVAQNEDVRLRARIAGSTVDNRVLAIQLLQSFRGTSTRSIINYLNDRANELAGTVGELSPIADALIIGENLHNINGSGRFFTGQVTTMCGSLGTAASCILKEGKQYGACSAKHLPMGIALIPTGPFCTSHRLPDSLASSISLHAMLTLSLFHIMSVIFASRGEDGDGTVSQPLNVTTLARGYTPAGDAKRLEALIDKYDEMNDDVHAASVRASEALGDFFKNITSGSLNTVTVSNGISALKGTTKILPVFVQQSIAARSWYLRMLNLINGDESVFVPANFTRANIVRRIFGSSTLLAMALNFNTNPGVVAETLEIIKTLFTNVSSSTLVAAGEDLRVKATPEQLVNALVTNSYSIPVEAQEGPVRLEAAFGVTMVKPTTTAKVPAANLAVFTHGPVVYGTAFVAANSTAKAPGAAQENSEFFQTPADELESFRARLGDAKTEKAAAKPGGKAATKSRAAPKSGTTSTSRGPPTVNVPVGDDEINIGLGSLDAVNLDSVTPGVSKTPAPASELRDSMAKVPIAEIQGEDFNFD